MQSVQTRRQGQTQNTEHTHTDAHTSLKSSASSTFLNKSADMHLSTIRLDPAGSNTLCCGRSVCLTVSVGCSVGLLLPAFASEERERSFSCWHKLVGPPHAQHGQQYSAGTLYPPHRLSNGCFHQSTNLPLLWDSANPASCTTPRGLLQHEG